MLPTIVAPSSVVRHALSGACRNTIQVVIGKHASREMDSRGCHAAVHVLHQPIPRISAAGAGINESVRHHA
jgi:hypothetical protein